LMPCSTRRGRRRPPAASSASTTSALPPPSWRTTRRASSPAKRSTSMAAITSSTSSCQSPSRLQGMGHIMARKRTAGGNAKRKMKRKAYEKELRELQVELCALQDWVKDKGARIILVFEGRDAAGKGGTIKALTERVSPRVFRTVALPAPSDREKSQMYMQRYMQHFPAAGEVTILDRSWYNRAGVEHVMGFCSKEQHRVFLKMCPEVEKYIVDAGIKLIKVWLEVSDKEQKRRFEARIDDPLRQWKLSPMDLPSRSKWFEYSRARDMMLD